MDQSASLNRLAWSRFKKNKLAYFSLWFIVLCIFTAILGYLITPDQSPMVNRQFLTLATKKPGFKATFIKIPESTGTRNNFLKTMIFGKKEAFQRIAVESYSFSENKLVFKEYGQWDSSVLYVSNLVFPKSEFFIKDSISDIYTIKEIKSGAEKQYNLKEIQRRVEKNNIITQHFWLGSDRYGRDVLSQLIIGMRVSLSVGFIAVLISLLLGITLGAIAGYTGGRTDAFITWIINVIWSVPTLLLVIAITFALGKGFWQVFIAVGLTMWVEVARVVRGQFISLRGKEYVEAARALGYKDTRIIFKHILPNAMAPVIVISAANFASAILLEAGLSFLGIGVQPPMPSWGTMLRENYSYIILDYAWLALLPGLAIMLMVLAFMLAGNGLRDALDVKQEIKQ